MEGAHGDKVVYGNGNGLVLLEEVSELRRDVKALLSEVKTVAMKDSKREKEDLKREEERKECKEEMQALQTKVTQLSQCTQDYMKIRKRYIAFYERDFKGRDFKGSDAIEGGNIRAHVGDAVADAMLFDEDSTLDKTLYEELYGLEPTKVLEWNGTYDIILLRKGLTKYIESGVEDRGLFRALNLHATSVTQGIMSEEVAKVFGTFITRVNQKWLQPLNKEPNTPLYTAYYAFLNKNRQLVKKRSMAAEK